MSAAGTDPNPEKTLEPQLDDPVQEALGSEPFDTSEEAIESAFSTVHKLVRRNRLDSDIKKFREEYTRLLCIHWGGAWENVPHWKIALGDEEAKLVDEVLKTQREKKYTEPRAVICDERTFDLLCIARNLLEDESGCITPAEHLIRALLFAADGGALTPNRLEIEVDEFRDNFRAAEQTARYFLRRYPQLVAEEQEQQ